jgi:hypothetical protein
VGDRPFQNGDGVRSPLERLRLEADAVDFEAARHVSQRRHHCSLLRQRLPLPESLAPGGPQAALAVFA